jgi:hypothetical protein
MAASSDGCGVDPGQKPVGSTIGSSNDEPAFGRTGDLADSSAETICQIPTRL